MSLTYAVRQSCEVIQVKKNETKIASSGSANGFPIVIKQNRGGRGDLSLKAKRRCHTPSDHAIMPPQIKSWIIPADISQRQWFFISKFLLGIYIKMAFPVTFFPEQRGFTDFILFLVKKRAPNFFGQDSPLLWAHEETWRRRPTWPHSSPPWLHRRHPTVASTAQHLAGRSAWHRHPPARYNPELCLVLLGWEKPGVVFCWVQWPKWHAHSWPTGEMGEMSVVDFCPCWLLMMLPSTWPAAACWGNAWPSPEDPGVAQVIPPRSWCISWLRNINSLFLQHGEGIVISIPSLVSPPRSIRLPSCDSSCIKPSRWSRSTPGWACRLCSSTPSSTFVPATAHRHVPNLQVESVCRASGMRV